jgi:hypothetical protein
MDDYGLTVEVRREPAARRAAAGGASLHAVCARHQVQRLFTITGLDRQVPLARTVVNLGMSKAELARRVGRNASSVRRLFSSSGARPELLLIVSLADALDAEVRIVPGKRKARRVATELHSERRVAVTT